MHTKEILTKDQKQHLADTVEKNYASICDATEGINAMRTEKGQNTVSVSTVWRKISKMPHRNVTTEVVCQGSDNPNYN